ncbi:peptide-N4-asparagine amidase [Longispora sp. NPDC051575]|uniref:peptide-N4-asparagine amidase n=1 Tax=Longispora sp. NPDC051575 TaxID=3154943 RepID=UPI00343FA0E7
MKKLLMIMSAVLALGMSGTAAYAAPPGEFGTDWDDPTTATPAIERPAGPSCTVRVVTHKFVNFDPYTSTYQPPAGCAGDWGKVVLDLHGAVKGRQFDRLGAMSMGGVTIFKTSTPEPSADGIEWKVEKDVTAYSALFRSPQPVWMLIGNVVNETYTGILDITVDLTFYAAGKAKNPAHTVQPLADPHREGTDQVGTVTLPRSTERLVAEVYATGSGGGCEEFWYSVAPADAAYSCAYGSGPYREVQVLVDGKLAGIAAPYPHIYTGGWGNPFLWYAVPAPRAFDVRPLTYDLGPFIGQLTDGQPHRLAVRVVGVPEGQSGWDVPTNVLSWQGSAPVTGSVTSVNDYPVKNVVTAADKKVTVSAGHRFAATGVLNTSRGQVTTSVDQTVTNDSTHTWTDGENHDELVASWSDQSIVTRLGVDPSVVRDSKRFSINGYTDVNEANRLVTKMNLLDAATVMTVGPGGVSWLRLDDSFVGEAGYTLGVPRPDRHATCVSQQTYKLNNQVTTVRTVNGYRV